MLECFETSAFEGRVGVELWMCNHAVADHVGSVTMVGRVGNTMRKTLWPSLYHSRCSLWKTRRVQGHSKDRHIRLPMKEPHLAGICAWCK